MRVTLNRVVVVGGITSLLGSAFSFDLMTIKTYRLLPTSSGFTAMSQSLTLSLCRSERRSWASALLGLGCGFSTSYSTKRAAMRSRISETRWTTVWRTSACTDGMIKPGGNVCARCRLLTFYDKRSRSPSKHRRSPTSHSRRRLRMREILGVKGVLPPPSQDWPLAQMGTAAAAYCGRRGGTPEGCVSSRSKVQRWMRSIVSLWSQSRLVLLLLWKRFFFFTSVLHNGGLEHVTCPKCLLLAKAVNYVKTIVITVRVKRLDTFSQSILWESVSKLLKLLVH